MVWTQLSENTRKLFDRISSVNKTTNGAVKMTDINKMTKPQTLLYWMAVCSPSEGQLTDDDRALLINYKVFKDRKSISNALHSLNVNGLVMKTSNGWCITDDGYDYVNNLLSAANGSSKTSKVKEQIETYASKLEAENAKLKTDLQNAYLRCKMLEDEVLSYRRIISSLKKSYSQLNSQYETCRVERDSLAEMNAELKKAVEDNCAQNQACDIYSDAAKLFSQAARLFNQII